MIDINQKVDINVADKKITEVLDELLANTDIRYAVRDRQILLVNEEAEASLALQQNRVTGIVTDKDGSPLPGVNVVVTGTTRGTTTDIAGKYSIEVPPGSKSLTFSFVGMKPQENTIGALTQINVTMAESAIGLEEVVVIGYGTMRKSDLTGSVVRIDDEVISERPNISVIQSLHGASPGLNIGQVNEAGEEPSLSIRGKTSLSGAQAPLIVVDGNIYRGNLIDLNPNDIGSIDILKDASAAAIYGSQATNGVIIITTKTGEVIGKPVINYSARYSFQEPAKDFEIESPEEQLQRLEAGYWKDSRTKESGYLEPNPTWNIRSAFRNSEQVYAYENNILTNWLPKLTNDNMYTQNHNLSLKGRTNNDG